MMGAKHPRGSNRQGGRETPGSGCPDQSREGVMTRIHIIVLVVGLVLMVCGCETSPQAQGFADSPLAAGGQNSPSRMAAGPREPTLCLEQYGFAVLDFRAIRDEYGRVSVVGEIRNVGSGPRGVELQATLRNAEGRIVAVGFFYPASYRSIVPGEIWPFTYSFGNRQEAVRAELRITGTFHTIDVMSTISSRP